MLIRIHRQLLISALSLLVLGTGTLPAWAATWYVKSSNTPLTAEPSARSKKLGHLSAGQAVNVLGTEGKFMKVSVGGKEGYVYKFKLTQNAPSGGGGGGGLDALVGDQKMAAAETSSGSSIRGLSPISESYAKGKGISPANIASVKNMESFSVPNNQVDQFQAEGGLGPYAK